MKGIYLLAGQLLLSLSVSYSQGVQSQDSLTTLSVAGAPDSAAGISIPIHKLKTLDRVLPRIALDLNYYFGQVQQQITLIDFSRAYAPNYLPSSFYSDTKFSAGRNTSGSVGLGWFFTKSRRIGIGIGAMYSQYTGTIAMDSLHIEYQDTDSHNYAYRQVIRSNSPLREDIRTTSLNIPILLKFKRHFGKSEKPSPFGVAVDAGGIFGLRLETTSTASGNFSYEAIYKLDNNQALTSGFDSSISPNTSTSLLLTEKAYNITNHSGGAIQYFDDLRSQQGAFNVGLYKGIVPLQRAQRNAYPSIGYGGIIQVSGSYELSYRFTFLLSGYYLYQVWNDIGDERYRITDRVIPDSSGQEKYGVNYRTLAGAARQTTYQTYGGSIGFRIYLGKKRDIDDDGIPDNRDHCILEYGEARFNGCPDRDHDGIPDAEDACPDEPGGEGTNGCPDDDQDGVPNKADTCRYVFGELRNGCPVTTDYLKSASVSDQKKTPSPVGLTEEAIVRLFCYGEYVRDSVAHLDSILAIEYQTTVAECIRWKNSTFTEIMKGLCDKCSFKPSKERKNKDSGLLDKYEIDTLVEKRFRIILDGMKKSWQK